MENIRSPFLKIQLKEKINNLEIQLCYSRYIALHFQPLQFWRFTDRFSTFYEHKEQSFN